MTAPNDFTSRLAREIARALFQAGDGGEPATRLQLMRFEPELGRDIGLGGWNRFAAEAEIAAVIRDFGKEGKP